MKWSWRTRSTSSTSIPYRLDVWWQFANIARAATFSARALSSQELRERVGDLPLAQMKQSAQQRELRWLRMLTQMHRGLDRGAGSPPGDDPRVDTREQAGGQADRADLDQHRLEAQVPRRRSDQPQHTLVLVVVVADGDQRLQTRDDGRVEAVGD